VSNNASAFRVLDTKIAMFGLVADVPTTCVPAVAAAIEKESHRTIAAGTTPDGVAWAPKKDGKDFKFVKASDIAVGAIGRIIITRIKTRHVVLHHLGYAWGYRGGVVKSALKAVGISTSDTGAIVARQVIPTAGRIPRTMSAVIKQAVLLEFQKAANGGKTS
jgi:hypothetical protein